jgi:hypothetical protein
VLPDGGDAVGPRIRRPVPTRFPTRIGTTGWDLAGCTVEVGSVKRLIFLTIRIGAVRARTGSSGLEDRRWRDLSSKPQPALDGPGCALLTPRR